MRLAAQLELTALLMATIGCGSDPTVSLVVAPDQSVDLGNLSRLRLIVRTCDSNQPALAENVPLDRTTNPRLEATVAPGTTFYVWLQGWEACNPPCIPEAEAGPNDCTCVGEEVPPAQIFLYEGCTEWIEAKDSIRRTLSLDPKATPPLCPPEPLARSECMTP